MFRLHRIGAYGTKMATALHVRAEAHLPVVRPLRELVADVARDHGFSERRAYDLKLCVHEAVTNVVLHAYTEQPGPVDVTVRDLGDELEVVVADQGTSTQSRLSGEKEGGLGFWLMSHLSQGCSVRLVDGKGMEVDMVFPLSSKSQDASGAMSPERPRLMRGRLPSASTG